MLTQPPELTDQRVADELRDHWGVRVDSIGYAAVGFGSHHWRVDDAGRRWFATVDDLDARSWSSTETRDQTFDRLRAALDTAASLPALGLPFVVPPVLTSGADVVRRLDDRFALALYPFVDGRAHRWGERRSPSDLAAVTDLIVRLHAVPLEHVPSARAEVHTISNRDDLHRALSELDRPWRTGPFAEAARIVLRDNARSIEHMLSRFDRLATEALRQRGRHVLTHGEPHIGNTIQTSDGWVLIDWDTALVAPPERDLWMLAKGNDSAIEAYAAATGRHAVTDVLDLYRLSWDLSDIAIYASLFLRSHDDTADVHESLTNLESTIRSGSAQTGSTDRI